MTCHIVGAGDFDPRQLSISQGDLVIAADAGLIHLKNAGIRPDLFIGDCDSLQEKPQGIDCIFLPTEKDDTDVLSAVREGLGRSYRHFALYGALGGKRFSHSLANLQVLSFLSKHQSTGEIIDPHCRVSLLFSGEHRLPTSGGYFSLFSFEGEALVSITGAKYPLTKKTLSSAFPLGVSNEGDENTRILVEKGNVFLVCEP